MERRRRPALNTVDWASRFQMITVFIWKNIYSLGSSPCLLAVGKIFGPPTKLYVDLGLGGF